LDPFFSPNKTKDLGLLKMGMIMMRKQRGEENLKECKMLKAT
jgi:hypothetical protein